MDQMSIITSLVGIQAAILMAGIPWAFKIQSTLVRIDTEMKTALNVRDDVDALKDRVLKLEINLHADS